MLKTAHFKSALLALTFAAVSAVSAYAGSAAYTINGTSLRLGPGAKYPVSGETIAEAASVDVQRCTDRWCLVEAGYAKGWTPLDNLSFGQHPRGPWTGPRLDRTHHGAGTICFFTGYEYTGQSVCAETGFTASDLALYGYDNAFRSVSVEGEISANVCSEFNFSSYCRTISSDMPRLPRLLSGRVSSFQVW